MAQAPKRRPGRPRKSPLEKQEQFSIRLPYMSKLVLEAIARHRNISLSQAVEFLVTDAGTRYKIGGKPILGTIAESLRDLAMKSPDGQDNLISLSQRVSEKVGQFSRSEVGRLLLLPDELLSPEERFFLKVLQHPDFPKDLNTLVVDHYMNIVLQTYNPTWAENDEKSVSDVVKLIREDIEKKAADAWANPHTKGKK